MNREINVWGEELVMHLVIEAQRKAGPKTTLCCGSSEFGPLLKFHAVMELEVYAFEKKSECTYIYDFSNLFIKFAKWIAFRTESGFLNREGRKIINKVIETLRETEVSKILYFIIKLI
jgi:hypothetical protein